MGAGKMKPKSWIGIDPGMTGAYAKILPGNDGITVHQFSSIHQAFNDLFSCRVAEKHGIPAGFYCLVSCLYAGPPLYMGLKELQAVQRIHHAIKKRSC